MNSERKVVGSIANVTKSMELSKEVKMMVDCKNNKTSMRVLWTKDVLLEEQREHG